MTEWTRTSLPEENLLLYSWTRQQILYSPISAGNTVLSGWNIDFSISILLPFDVLKEENQLFLRWMQWRIWDKQSRFLQQAVIISLSFSNWGGWVNVEDFVLESWFKPILFLTAHIKLPYSNVDLLCNPIKRRAFVLSRHSPHWERQTLHYLCLLLALSQHSQNTAEQVRRASWQLLSWTPRGLMVRVNLLSS